MVCNLAVLWVAPKVERKVMPQAAVKAETLVAVWALLKASQWEFWMADLLAGEMVVTWGSQWANMLAYE